METNPYESPTEQTKSNAASAEWPYAWVLVPLCFSIAGATVSAFITLVLATIFVDAGDFGGIIATGYSAVAFVVGAVAGAIFGFGVVVKSRKGSNKNS